MKTQLSKPVRTKGLCASRNRLQVNLQAQRLQTRYATLLYYNLFRLDRSCQRALLMFAMLIITVSPVCSTVDVYPPLTRETLVGTWQGVFGIGTHPVVLHIVIAHRDADSYLSEIYPDSMKGRLFRLASSTVARGKIDLDFHPIASGESGAWRIQGEGFGDQHHGWINSQIGYLEKSTWVRDLGEAASRAEEKIPKSPNVQK